MDTTAAGLVELIDRLAHDPEVRSSAAEAARARGAPVKKLPGAEVARHIDAVLDALRAGLLGDPELAARALAAADDLAADRVEQGISLRTLLDGVQSARSVLLESMLVEGRELFGADALLTLLPTVDLAVSRLQNSMVLAYRAAEQRLARSARSRRADAVRQLLEGGPSSWAAEAGLTPSGSYHCLVADVAVPAEARRLEPHLEDAHGVSVLIHGVLCAVRSDLPATPPPALMVHSPAVPVAELAVAYAHCRAALDRLRERGGTGSHALLGSAVPLALDSSPWLGEVLARKLLTGLDPADETHRVIASTVLGYLENGGRLQATADRMHVHPNTLKHRLRRFEELTAAAGVPSPRERELMADMRLWWALTAWDNAVG